MKIAVASHDHLVIQDHFGHARQFLIYKCTENQCELVEIRKLDPLCGSAEDGAEDGHSEDRLQEAIRLISDCKAVVTARIGRPIVARLSMLGIHAIVIPGFIDESLKRLLGSGLLQKPVNPLEENFQWIR
jgi:nitrogen fixation protein NifB